MPAGWKPRIPFKGRTRRMEKGLLKESGQLLFGWLFRLAALAVLVKPGRRVFNFSTSRGISGKAGARAL
jgi:hypothetical protein